jgi:hypothetical protein
MHHTIIAFTCHRECTFNYISTIEKLQELIGIEHMQLNHRQIYNFSVHLKKKSPEVEEIHVYVLE